MKQKLKKLKGYQFKIGLQQVVLKQPCRIDQSNRDQLFYLTNIENYLCKVIDFQYQRAIQKFRSEKNYYIYLKQFNNIAKLIYYEESQFKKLRFGLFVFDKIKKNSSLTDNIPLLKQQSEIIPIVKQILKFLIQIHQKQLVYFNLKPQNILANINKTYSFINFQKTINKGLNYQQIKNHYYLTQSIQQTFKYVSPQMLDTFSKEFINWKSDIFSFGSLVYEICYKKYPYTTPLSVINVSYTIPQQQQDSFQILNIIIKKCLVDVRQRPTGKQILEELQRLDKQLNKFDIIQPKQQQNDSIINNSGIFDHFKNVINKMTKQSQSWVLYYTEQNQKDPQDKYVNNLLTKIHKNNSKLQKIYNLIYKHTQNRINNRYCIQKTLCLLLNLMRRGPKQTISMSYKNTLKQINDLIWKYYGNNTDALCCQICKINKLKYELISNYGDIFQGNFHIGKIDVIQKININIIENLIKYAIQILSSYEKIHTLKYSPNYIKNILLDQIYDLITTLILLFITTMKDHQLKKRKLMFTQKFNHIQFNLQKILKQIHKIYKPKTHPLSTLESSFMNYKYNIQFEPIQATKNTTFEIYFKNQRTYMNLNLPLPFSNLFKPKQQTFFSSNKSTLIYKTQVQNDELHQDQQQKVATTQDNQFFNVFQNQQRKSIIKESHPNIINNSAIKQQVPNKFFDLWNQETIPQKAKKIQIKQIENKFPLFSQFKQPSTPKIDFDVIWKSNTVQNLQSNKVQSKNHFNFEQFEQLNKMNNKNQSKKNLNFVQKQKKDVNNNFLQSNCNNNSKSIINNKYLNNYGSHINNNNSNYNDNSSNNKLTNNTNFNNKLKNQNNDLLDFNQKSQVIEPTINLNKDFLFDFVLDDAKSKNNKSSKLIQLQISILKDLKQPTLKQLLKSSNLIIQFQSLIFNKTIGCGSAGQVFQGVYNNMIVAIKKIKSHVQNANAFKQFQRQLITLIRIGKHQNLVSLIGITKHLDQYSLLMDYCEGGNLFELLHRRSDLNISWKMRISVAKQVAFGMNYLHSCKPQIIHRDLKSLNILIKNKYNSFDQSINIKVTDFGLSRNPDAQYMTSALGTLHWMAPELLEGKNYSLKVDIYSYGIVLWQVCSRQTPYKQFKSPHSIMKYVTMEGGRPNLNRINSGCPQQIKRLIIRCWNIDENMRPDFKQIINILSRL